MAKTIKFNLIVDEKPVRTLEALRENFVVEDVLEALRGGLLLRWLETRGYTEEADKIRALTDVPGGDAQTMKKVIAALGVEADEEEIRKSLYLFQYRAERDKRYQVYLRGKEREDKIIGTYFTDYFKLVDVLLNTEDAAKIKATIAEMVGHYAWALEVDYRALFLTLSRNKRWLSIMCLLMNPVTRKYYLPVEIKSSEGSAILDVDRKLDPTDSDYERMEFKKQAFAAINAFVNQRIGLVQEGLGEKNLRIFAGNTGDFWKDLEASGKQYMILRMGVFSSGATSSSLDYIRSARVDSVEYSTAQANGKFLILDGIDYKSTNSGQSVLYMEV